MYQISDESYYRSYFIYKLKEKRAYLKKICLVCDEVIDLGFGKLNHSDFTIAPKHICRKFENPTRYLLYYIPNFREELKVYRSLLEEKGFLIKEVK